MHLPQAMRQRRCATLFLPPLVFLLMYCASGCVAAAPAPEYRCGVDEMMRRSGPLLSAVVREVPRKGQDATPVYGLAAQGASSEWAPIRIKVSVNDMCNPSRHCTKAGETRIDHFGNPITCESEDVLTEEKRDILLKQIFPAAIKLHSERLSVRPVTGFVPVPRTYLGICRNFTIPRKHHTVGVSNADMVIYANAFPTGGLVGWAAVCATLPDGRPFVTAANFHPKFIEATNSYVRSAAHEVGHALGFERARFFGVNMISVVRNVRGRTVWVISTPEVKRTAREYYNCSTLEGMELENDGGMSSALSHWDKRNAKDELMSPTMGIGYYSAMTLAAFADLGMYKVNYSMAEPLRWGNNSGCGLLERKCLTNNATDYPDMFCNEFPEGARYLCTHDRLSLGFCAIQNHTQPLPAEYQYFSDSRLGGFDEYLDKCPVVEAYSNAGCTNGDPLVMPGSFVGPNSRCVKGNNLQVFNVPIGDVCVNTRCNGGTLSVQFSSNATWYECREGETVTPPGDDWSGSIVCPKYADLCTVFPNISAYPIPVVVPPLAASDTPPRLPKGCRRN